MRVPETDTHICFLLQERSKVFDYQCIFEGQGCIESNLIPHIREHLNNEIGLLTVRDFADCKTWLRSTFFYVRMKKRPAYYAQKAKVNLADCDEMLAAISQKALAHLCEVGMVNVDETTHKLEQMEPGRILSHYFLRMDTMQSFGGHSNKHLSLEGALWLLASSAEFNEIVLRRSEKKLLNNLHTSQQVQIRYKIRDANKPDRTLKAIKTPMQKVFLLLQEALIAPASSTLDHALRSERDQILKTSPRIAAAAAQYFLHHKCLAASANTLILAKSLRHKMFADAPDQCRLLSTVGKVISERLVRSNLGTIDALEKATPHDIEKAAIQRYPFGTNIKSQLKKWPPYFSIELEDAAARNVLHLRVIRSDGDVERVDKNRAILMVGCRNTDLLLFHERVCLEDMPDLYERFIPGPKAAEAHKGKEGVVFVAALITEKLHGRDVHKQILRSSSAQNAIAGARPDATRGHSDKSSEQPPKGKPSDHFGSGNALRARALSTPCRTHAPLHQRSGPVCGAAGTKRTHKQMTIQESSARAKAAKPHGPKRGDTSDQNASREIPPRQRQAKPASALQLDLKSMYGLPRKAAASDKKDATILFKDFNQSLGKRLALHQRVQTPKPPKKAIVLPHGKEAHAHTNPFSSFACKGSAAKENTTPPDAPFDEPCVTPFGGGLFCIEE